MKTHPTHIIINQIKNIGDVILCLPLAGLIKHHFPACKVSLLASAYTHSAAACCPNIDTCLDWDQWQTLSKKDLTQQFKQLNASHIIHLANNKRIAKTAYQARIPYRVGTCQRLYHWLYCNKMINQARRNSPYHELQLNAHMLRPLGINNQDSMQALLSYMHLIPPDTSLPAEVEAQLSGSNFKLLIHPGSNGHGREWPSEQIQALCQSLPEGIDIFLTGSQSESLRFASLAQSLPKVYNTMGKLSLKQLIHFIDRSDGLIASGTGPVHISAALNKPTLGLFPPRRGISPKRWHPPGRKAQVLMHQRKGACLSCRTSVGCACMAKITPKVVAEIVYQWSKDQ